MREEPLSFCWSSSSFLVVAVVLSFPSYSSHARAVLLQRLARQNRTHPLHRPSPSSSSLPPPPSLPSPVSSSVPSRGEKSPFLLPFLLPFAFSLRSKNAQARRELNEDKVRFLFRISFLNFSLFTKKKIASGLQTDEEQTETVQKETSEASKIMSMSTRNYYYYYYEYE